jgi:hypothetical protein
LSTRFYLSKCHKKERMKDVLMVCIVCHLGAVKLYQVPGVSLYNKFYMPLIVLFSGRLRIESCKECSRGRHLFTIHPTKILTKVAYFCKICCLHNFMSNQTKYLFVGSNCTEGSVCQLQVGAVRGIFIFTNYYLTL